MKNLIACIAAGAAILIGAPADAAGVFRAYLSSKGNDANPCSVTAPCRLVPAALLAVADGGEIWMLDSANYNTATVIVSKSVTILAIPGAVGSFVSTGGGPAITVPIAGKALTLRNVMVVPLPGGGGGDGVFVGNGAVATLEDSLIANNVGNGIVASGTAKVKVARSTIRDNTLNGIVAQGGASVNVVASVIMGNEEGIFLETASSSATVSDSAIVGNIIGVDVSATNDGDTMRAVVTRSTVADNSDAGIHVVDQSTHGATPVATVGDSMVTVNGVGLVRSQLGGALLETQGNNLVRQSTSAVDTQFTTPFTSF